MKLVMILQASLSAWAILLLACSWSSPGSHVCSALLAMVLTASALFNGILLLVIGFTNHDEPWHLT